MKVWLALILSSIGFVAFSPEAPAQKVDKEYFEMAEYRFRFKPLRDYKRIPPQTDEKEFGVIGKMEGKELSLNFPGQGVVPYNPEIQVFRFVDRKVAEVEDTSGSGTRTAKYERVDLAEYVGRVFRGVNEKATLVDEKVQLRKGLEARHRQWGGSISNGDGPYILDTWSFEVGDADVHLVFTVPEKYQKKYLRAFKNSAKTFEQIEYKAAPRLHSGMSYEERLEYYDNDERNQGGWRAYPTDSKKYIVKYDGEDKGFIKKVIDRLEASRRLFEQDFPPSEPMTHVSVVRVCSTEEVFHSYGGTGGGVAGWFSPASTELVLYDGKNIDRNMTFAVMTHEAFHQYCHFLFNESAAHRWFDEGHGDYYGGAKMGRSKKSPMKITPKMPGGLERLGIIRELVRTGTYIPIEEHINYDHRTWQALGTDSYSQSWSIIYYLRQGTLGKVPSKIWKKEYADIIPNYMRVLSEEFEKAYDEAREKEIKRRKDQAKREKAQREREKRERERRKKGKDKSKKDGKDGKDGQDGQDGKDGDAGKDAPEGKSGADGKDGADGKSKNDGETDAEPNYDIPNSELYLGERTKKQIWKKAIEASWGQVDIDELEEKWVVYVSKHI